MVDWRIGVQYKRAVYISMTKVIMEQVKTTRAAVGGDITVTFEPLKSNDKRVQITKVIVNTHERISVSTSYFMDLLQLVHR